MLYYLEIVLYTKIVRKIVLLSIAFILFSVFFTTSVQAAVTWSETQPAGNTDNPWTPVAMSSDGQIIIVGSQNGGLYLSENGGDTWAETQPDGDIDWNWLPVSMSSNGQIILAGVLNNRLYITTNGGDTWTETRPGGDSDLRWYTTSMSSNGQILLAGVNNGRLYRSTNAGTDWAEVRPVGNTNQEWRTSIVSSDGQTMFAGIDGARLYRSIDGGDNWTEVRPAGDMDVQWNSLGLTGQTVLAGALNGRLYRSLTGGDTWEELRPAGDNDATWSIASISSDGRTMFVSNSLRLYISTDTGDTWTETRPLGDTDQTWNGGAISRDSQVLVAVVYDGRAYLGSNPYPPSQPVYHPPSTTDPPSCNASTPAGVPDLFKIDTAGTYANLYFSTVSGSQGYNVTYGLNSSANQYGDNFNYSGSVWTYGRTIKGLSPNTTYYFKVQGTNGCNAGGWSQTVSAKTKSENSILNQWFANLAN